MNDKPNFLCPHCGIHSLHIQLEPTKALPQYKEEIVIKAKDGQEYPTDVQLQHFIFECVNCKKHTYILFQNYVAIHRKPGDWSPGPTSLGQPPIAEENAKIIHQYPIATPIIHDSVPDEIKKAAIEAEKCLSVRAFNACGVMTRRAIHSLCQNKGATGKDLYEQLKFLKENHLITPDLWEWAEELRVIGRSGAHPEWEEVTPEEADYAVNFLREIIRYVYINPAERASRKLKETKKKKTE
ncbi:MAG: DUF4145 domain-containing protein [candidate division Zixibacteria bacterium]|nr:DUF4145 domain-containing protein [candidate division Zixibacteria bacterium]